MNPIRRFGVPMLYVLLTAACTYDPDFEPARPAQLPESAVYAGNERRGNWATCTPAEANKITCILYDPFSGRPQFEKSLRLCPHLTSIGGWEVANPRPKRFDAQQVTFADVAAFIDKPDKYLPAPGEAAKEVARQEELSNQVYKKYGVNADCTPVSESH